MELAVDDVSAPAPQIIFNFVLSASHRYLCQEHHARSLTFSVTNVTDQENSVRKVTVSS